MSCIWWWFCSSYIHQFLSYLLIKASPISNVFICFMSIVSERVCVREERNRNGSSISKCRKDSLFPNLSVRLRWLIIFAMRCTILSSQWGFYSKKGLLFTRCFDLLETFTVQTSLSSATLWNVNSFPVMEEMMRIVLENECMQFTFSGWETCKLPECRDIGEKHLVSGYQKNIEKHWYHHKEWYINQFALFHSPSMNEVDGDQQQLTVQRGWTCLMKGMKENRSNKGKKQNKNSL